MEHFIEFIEFLKEVNSTDEVKSNKLTIDLVQRGDKTIFVLV